MALQDESIELHTKLKGKIEVRGKAPVRDRRDLSLLYTPGVGAVSSAIAKEKKRVWELTGRGNAVAIITDGSAVLGLGNLGPEAALPVMEGKALLFKEFTNVDAYPICLATQDADEIVRIVTAIAPGFGGINLEDISAPRCFDIEKRLQHALDIPVFHDDQHGTAIVVLAGLLNAAKLAGKELSDLLITISGAGAAGTATALLLNKVGVADVVVVDSKGIISRDRSDLSEAKKRLALATNRENISGSLSAAIRGRDVFIGVSAPGVLTMDMIAVMASDPIIFAMANPVPEIMPEIARAAGARLVATGRSDFPNQINNVLAFPGVFRGLLDGRLPYVTDEMKIAAAHAIAGCIESTAEQFVPSVLDRSVARAVAAAIKAFGTLQT